MSDAEHKHTAESGGSTMDRDTEVTLHPRKFGQVDRVTTGGSIEDLVRQFQSLPEAKKSEYSIMVGSMEYGPHEIEDLARELQGGKDSTDSE
jgi:hypothetical protein